VVTINIERGFFFLNAGGPEDIDYFAHKDSLPKGTKMEHIDYGQEFEFDAIPDAPRGPRAANLQRV
jgi:cold shock CspA family protein